MSAIFEAIDTFRCPTCTRELRPEVGPATVCPACGWEGQATLFRPLRPRADESENALPEDAVCAHHARKKAVAICAGTGDYVCALCAVEVGGHTYSAQYLDGPGKDKLTEASRRYFQRPDSGVLGFVALSLLLILLAPVFIPCAVYQFIQMIRLRRQSPMYRRLVGRGRIVFLSVALAFITLFALLAAVGFTVALLQGSD